MRSCGRCSAHGLAAAGLHVFFWRLSFHAALRLRLRLQTRYKLVLRFDDAAHARHLRVAGVKLLALGSKRRLKRRNFGLKNCSRSAACSNGLCISGRERRVFQSHLRLQPCDSFPALSQLLLARSRLLHTPKSLKLSVGTRALQLCLMPFTSHPIIAVLPIPPPQGCSIRFPLTMQRLVVLFLFVRIPHFIRDARTILLLDEMPHSLPHHASSLRTFFS
jgi:hypothetical protein